MPDRPLTRDIRETPTSTDNALLNAILIGIVLAIAVAVLFLFGPSMFSEKGADVNTMQPNVQAPATGENNGP